MAGIISEVREQMARLVRLWLADGPSTQLTELILRQEVAIQQCRRNQE